MPLSRRNLILGAMGAAVMSAHPARASTTSVGGPAFGSSWRATVEATADAERVRRMIQDVVTEFDARFSPYRPDSDLSAFNAVRSPGWQPVQPTLASIVHEAMRIAEMTGGFFDPTVGPLVARQGFGPISGRAATFDEIEVGERRLRRTSPGVTLDLCGIAKGAALDRIIRTISIAGIGNAIVDIGGEVKAVGSHPAGRPWTAAVADPNTPGTARHIVTPRSMALATSGHTVNGVRGRVDTSHIIDPHRRRPATQSVLSVSVLDSSALRADALATAFCAAGPDFGLRLASRLNATALFILDDAAGPGERVTGGFERHILV